MIPTWVWLVAALAAIGCLLLAMKLWGAQIIAGLVRMAFKAVLSRSKGLETPDEMRRRVREGRERKDRGR